MITTIAGGKKSSGWLLEACAEYEKRLRKPFKLEWQFIDEDKIAGKVSKLSGGTFVILLDENGKMLDSVELSSCLKNEIESGRDVVVVIGGAFGHFAPELIERANLVWSLSR